MNKQPLVAILSCSIRPDALTSFFGNIEDTLDDPTLCEVFVKIDSGDTVMLECLESEEQKRQFAIKYIVTPKLDGYWSLWQACNQMSAMVSESTHFIIGLNDQCRFETKGWDSCLKKYTTLFPEDGIFHLRISPRKNYKFRHLGEAIVYGESFAFFSKRWIELTGGWAIGAAGGDSGQEAVNFFLRNNFGIDRGVPIDDIKMGDEDVAISPFDGMSMLQAKKKITGIYRNYTNFLSRKWCMKFAGFAGKLASGIGRFAKEEYRSDKILMEANPNSVSYLHGGNKVSESTVATLSYEQWFLLLTSNNFDASLEENWNSFPPVLATIVQIAYKLESFLDGVDMDNLSVRSFLQINSDGEMLRIYWRICLLLPGLLKKVDPFYKYLTLQCLNRDTVASPWKRREELHEEAVDMLASDKQGSALLKARMYMDSSSLKLNWSREPSFLKFVESEDLGEFDKYIDEFMSSLSTSESKVLLYGAGQETARFILNTDLTKIHVVGIIDSDSNNSGKTFFGYKIVTPKMVTSLDVEAIFISSWRYGSAMAAEVRPYIEEDISIFDIFARREQESEN